MAINIFNTSSHVRFEDTGGSFKITYPRGEYKPDLVQERINIYRVSETQRVYSILSVDDVNSIDDDGNNVPVPGTLSALFDILEPFFFSVNGGGGAFNLTVEEQDLNPSVSNVDTIKVTNGTLTDDGGGTVSIDISAFNLTVKEDDNDPTVANVDTINVTNGKLSDDGGGQVTLDLTGDGFNLTVEEQDSNPTVSNVNTIKFDNGLVTDDGGGVVSVASGALATTSTSQTPRLDNTLFDTNRAAMVNLDGCAPTLMYPMTTNRLVYHIQGETGTSPILIVGIYQQTDGVSGDAFLLDSVTQDIEGLTGTQEFALDSAGSINLKAGRIFYLWGRNSPVGTTITMRVYSVGTVDLVNSNLQSGTIPDTFLTNFAASAALPASFDPYFGGGDVLTGGGADTCLITKLKLV